MKKKYPLLFYDEKYALSILLTLWVLSQLVAYIKFGIFVSVDSTKYIHDAQLINEGFWPEQRNFWYSAYSFLLATIQYFGGEPIDIVIVQVFASGIASVAIYKLTQKISQNNASAFVATLLYISWIKIHQWNMILYTDSLFTSATIISITMIHFSTNRIHYLISFMAVIFTILIRPVGIGFVIAIGGYVVFNLLNQKQIKRSFGILIVAISTLFCILLLNFVLRDYVDSFLESYAKAEIIYPNISLNVDKPDDLIMPNNQYPPIIKLSLFIINNPLFILKISLIKAILFLAHVKPYYSIFHNTLICLFLFPIYFFMLKGLKLFNINGLKIYMIIFISFQIITVSLTSENWDGRFLIPILPYIFIISSLEISRLAEIKLKWLTSRKFGT